MARPRADGCADRPVRKPTPPESLPRRSPSDAIDGIAIDERWIDLFRRTGTQVSISLDGPQPFHDARWLTRNGQPTWNLALRGLKLLQGAGHSPSVITVLHPQGLDSDREYYEFYRDNEITDVSFSIDEMEGHNTRSSFDSPDYKPLMASFIARIMRPRTEMICPFIREIERIAHILAGKTSLANEQVERWASIVVAADGKVSTYSPEFMEVIAPGYDSFVFGNVLDEDLDNFVNNAAFRRARPRSRPASRHANGNANISPFAAVALQSTNTANCICFLRLKPTSAGFRCRLPPMRYDRSFPTGVHN